MRKRPKIVILLSSILLWVVTDLGHMLGCWAVVLFCVLIFKILMEEDD